MGHRLQKNERWVQRIIKKYQPNYPIKKFVVINDDRDSDKENIPPNNTTFCIEKNVEHEIFDLVKNIVSNAKESNEQVNIDNNNDSDWTENESVYN